MADTRKWQKTSIPGIYKQVDTRGTERFKVVYESREILDGRTVMRQRSQVFAAPKGKRVHRITEGSDSRLVTTYDAARHFKAQRDAARKAGHATDVAADETTVDQLWPRYLDAPAKRARHNGKRSAAQLDKITRSYTNHIRPTFGDVPVRSIKKADVTAWYGNLDPGKGTAGGESAKKTAALTLKAFFAYAVKTDHAVSNPAEILDLPADNVRPLDPDDVPTDADIEKLKDAIDDRYRLMVDLLASGLRIGEVVGLHRTDINLRGHITIRHNLVEVAGEMVPGPLKSRNSYRTLELEHLRDVIQRHIGDYSEESPDGYVFTGPRGNAPIQTNNWRRRGWSPALKAAGLSEFTPHTLRHRIAWDLIDRGMTVDQVADWIGDTPQTVRAVYANHPKIKSRSEISAHLGERYREANRVR